MEHMREDTRREGKNLKFCDFLVPYVCLCVCASGGEGEGERRGRGCDGEGGREGS